MSWYHIERPRFLPGMTSLSLVTGRVEMQQRFLLVSSLVPLLIEFYRAVPWLRSLVAGFSWSHRLNTRQVRLGFVVDEVALG